MPIKNYISGWEALNIPTNDGYTADWHPQFYFNKNKELKTYSYNEILKDSGISKRYIPFLNKDEYTANYPRAIADLVYDNNTKELKNCVYDFLNEDEALELFEYLKIINKHKDIEDFMKYELTKLYFKEFKNSQSHLGDYPLKIEVSNRNKLFLQNNSLKYENIDKVNVYSINELIKMKTIAFSGRDKIRDFYDLGYLLEKYPNNFSKESLFAIHEKVSYAGVEELNLLLKDEVQKHKLVDKDKIDITDNYSQNILKKVEFLIENDKKPFKLKDKTISKNQDIDINK